MVDCISLNFQTKIELKCIKLVMIESLSTLLDSQAANAVLEIAPWMHV